MRAFVSGGGRGIGAGIARALAEEGWAVVVGARSREQVEAVAGEIGGEWVQVDVADRRSVERAVAEVGEVDLLVANAGVDQQHAPSWEIDPAEWWRVYEINVSRFQRAEGVWERKLWRDQLRDWDENVKPESIRTHRELQSVNPDALSDDELVQYLTRCRDRHSEMIYQHMRFTGAALLPTGDLLAHAGEWTDVPPAELLGMLRGSAPVFRGRVDGLGQLIDLDHRLRRALAGRSAEAALAWRLPDAKGSRALPGRDAWPSLARRLR